MALFSDEIMNSVRKDYAPMHGPTTHPLLREISLHTTDRRTFAEHCDDPASELNLPAGTKVHVFWLAQHDQFYAFSQDYKFVAVIQGPPRKQIYMTLGDLRALKKMPVTAVETKVPK